MNQKKLQISTLIMTVLLFIFGIIDTIILKNGRVFSVINPILFIATVGIGIFAFSETVSFKSKWTWVALTIFFTHALSDVAGIIASFTFDFDVIHKVMGIILAVLFAAGTVLVFMSILFKQFFKLMPIGMFVLSGTKLVSLLAGLLIDKQFTPMSVFVILFYAIYGLLALGEFESIRKLLRLIAVVLAVVLLGSIGLFEAIAFIILAFLLVPGGKLVGIRARHVVAALCIVTAIAGVLTAGNPFSALGDINERIDDAKEALDFCDVDVKECKKIVSENEKELEKFASDHEEALENVEKAEEELADVCGRYYYDSWFCDEECEELHDKVSECYDELDEIEDEMSEFEDAMSSAKNDLERYDFLKDNLSALRIKRTELIVNGLLCLIAMLFFMAAFVCFAICLFRNKYDMLSIIACALMAVSSLIYLFTYTESMAMWSFDILNIPIFVLMFSLFLWSIAAIAMLAVIFLGVSKKRVLFRVLTIIAAVIMIPLSVSMMGVAPSAGIVTLLYAITLISFSFVLVPAVFTEYNSIGKHIFLSLITFGIWHYIWIYNVTKNLNKVSYAEKRRPVVELLLCIFLPFYYVYWLYKTAEAVEGYGMEYNRQFKIDILCLATGIVCSIASEIVIQDKINKIVGKPQ